MLLLLESHTTHIGNLDILILATGHDVIHPFFPGHNFTLASTDRHVFLRPNFKYQV